MGTLDEVARETLQNTGPKYWAAETPDRLISALRDKERSYFEFCQRRYYSIWAVMRPTGLPSRVARKKAALACLK